MCRLETVDDGVVINLLKIKELKIIKFRDCQLNNALSYFLGK